jgi:hypothetical protein
MLRGAFYFAFFYLLAFILFRVFYLLAFILFRGFAFIFSSGPHSFWRFFTCSCAAAAGPAVLAGWQRLGCKQGDQMFIVKNGPNKAHHTFCQI